MKIRLKKFLNKHKNRIFSFIAVIAFMPLFGFNAFADSVSVDYTNTFRYTDSIVLQSAFSNTFDYNTGDIVNDKWVHTVTLNTTNSYVYSTAFNHITYGLGVWFMNPWDFIYLPELYDYYFLVGHYSETNAFLADKIYLYYRDGQNNIPYIDADFDINNITSLQFKGYQYSFKVDFEDYSSISSIALLDSSGGNISNSIQLWFNIVPVPKNANEEQVNSIISAINNQTDILGGYIDNGNDSTGGIVSGNNSAIGQLDEVVSEYHATEQQFFDDFNTNQQAITSDIVGWSWGGLVNCANWVGSTMTDYYINMGDFRQYIIYPLMLGIVLFFLGRGGSIIGHLFRKPTETTVNTKSVFRREGNTRYTTTTTSRQGGVFRK